MIHVVGIVINSRYLIEGLVLEGKPSEFGEISDKPKIRKTVSRASLLANSFSNSEVVCKDNKIIRKEGFKFSDCELYTIKDTKIHKIKDNTISILRRIIQNNETIGFEVKLIGGVSKFSTSNVIALSTIFKPVGYTVAARKGEEARIDPKTKKLITLEVRKPYLTGIGGNKLSDLPVLVIDNIDKNKNKAKSDSKVTSKQEIKSKKEELKISTKTIQNIDVKYIEPDASKVGLIDLILLARACNGVIVTNSETTYSRQTVDKEDKENTDFVPLDMVQVAEPHVISSDKTVNINLRFRKLGLVYVDGTPVPTFMWREKSIFSNGKPNLSKFSIACTIDVAKKILEKFGSSLAIDVNDKDKKILGSIKALGIRKDVECLLNIDASKLSITADFSSVEGFDSIENFRNSLFTSFMSKTLIKIAKEVKEQYKKWDTEKSIFPAYRQYNKETLEKIKELGVNLFDGSYNTPLIGSVTDDGSVKSDSNNIEIEYFLAGCRTVPKVSDFLLKGEALGNAKKLAVTKFNNDLDSIVTDMQSESSVFYEGLPKKIVDIAMFGVSGLLATFYIDKDKLSDEDGAKIVQTVDSIVNDSKSNLESLRIAYLYYKLKRLVESRFENYGDGGDWEPKKARANQKADIYEWKKNEAVNLSLRNISFNN